MAAKRKPSKTQLAALDAAQSELTGMANVMAKIDALLASTPTYVDYVVRFSKPGTYMRSQVFRALDEAAAVEAAVGAVTSGNWQGWAIVDVATVKEAKARLGVSGG